jgi:hydroxyethylthiazole kinase
VLDPVGAGASKLRTDISKKILEEIHVDVIRGNLSEVMAIFSENQKTNGVDANDADTINESTVNNIADLAKNFSKRFGGILAITGEIDIVTDGDLLYIIHNGRPEMQKVTGTGCMLSGMLTAFISANRGNEIVAAVAATCMMGIAGEIGVSRMEDLDGNSALRGYIIDALYNMDGKSLDKMARYEIL